MSRSKRQAANKRPSLLGLLGSSSEARLISLFVVLVAVVFVRLLILGVIDAPALAAQSESQRTSVLEVPARRGTIFDRNGNALAMSVDATTIYVNPSEVINVRDTADALAEVLGGSSETYVSIIMNSASPTFAYLVRQVDVQLAENLQARNEEYRQAYIAELPEGDDVPAIIPTALTGIHYLTDNKRVYPYGQIGAQVIGAVDSDSNGISGIELTYDSILRGASGSITVESGKDDTPMPGGVHDEEAPIDGQDIIISIDIELQQFLENNLSVAGEEHGSENASSLVLDGATGEILATASLPLYSREELTEEDAALGATTAKAITWSYEPGSIFKSMTAAALLDTDAATIEDTFFCPAYLDVYDHTISDAHERSDMTMSLTEIIGHSSNVGITLAGQRMTNETLYTHIADYGFGQPTHVDYPGESFGLVADYEDWSPVQAANVTFGQGIAITPLQAASFYGAVANDGVMIQPHFLIARPNYDSIPAYDSTSIMTTDTAKDLEVMLRSVVTDGTGQNAALDGYEVVGKTGTAEKPSAEGGYMEDEFIVSFVGYINNSSSDVVFISTFDDPVNPLGDPPSTELFSTVMNFVANRYMVVPVEESANTPLAAPTE